MATWKKIALATGTSAQFIRGDGSLGDGGSSLNGTGYVKASGTTISYVNETYSLSSHAHSSISFLNDAWHLSADAKQRFYFAINDRTFFGSQNGYVFRSANDAVDLATLTNAGSLTITGALAASNLSGTNTGDQNLSGYATVGHNHSGVYAPVAHSHTDAAADAAGFMSSANFTKLGAISGTNTGDQTNISGNAATATTATNFNNGTSYSSGNSIFTDTLEPNVATDWLELTYYNGAGVRIGTGVNGSRPLYAGSLYDAGNRVYSAGNPQVNITGNAATAGNAVTVAGLAVNGTTNNAANQIVRTQDNGYAHFGWINTISGLATGTPARVYCSEDGYLRYYNMSTFTGYVQAAASGTWGINVTGTSNNITAYTINQSLGTGNSPTFTDIYAGQIVASNWLRTTGHTGVYSNTYGSHFRPNTEQYGNWEIYGNAVNGWNGLRFSSVDSSLMIASNESGIHRAGYGWQFRWDNGTLYCHKNAYGGGTAAAVIDSTTIGSQSVSYASTAGSVTNAATANGANGNFYIDDNYGNTVVGVYESHRYQGVFAMGDAYKLPADGTSTGNLYGLAWSHPNAGGVAANLNDHGLLVINNGTYAAAISSSIRAASDMRAPIFYDSNNTGYYLDPNGTSRLEYLRPNRISLVNNQDNGTPRWDFKAYVVESQHHYGQNSTQDMYLGEDNFIYIRSIGQASGSFRAPIFYDSNDTGYYLDPNNTSNLSSFSEATRSRLGLPRITQPRSNITGDNNYWTGTIGWGGDPGFNNAWQYGFCGLDSWGGDTGHPQGAVHAQGIQSGQHHASGYGWQMVGADGATANRYWARGKWGGAPSGWVEFITSGNIGSQSVSYASSAGSAPANGGTSSNTNSISNVLGTSHTWTSTNYFRSNNNTASGNSYPLQAYSDNASGAVMSFHRSGQYAVNMGLDSDNVFRIGGWSAPANLMTLNMEGDLRALGNLTGVRSYATDYHYSYGNIYAVGSINAYWSDDRLKTKVSNITNALSKVSSLNGFYYTNNELANSFGYTDKDTYVGLSAQEVQNVLPEIVKIAPFDMDMDTKLSKSGENYMTIQYERIVPLLIEAIKELKLEIDLLKARIN